MILLIDNYDPHMREFYKFISEEYSDTAVIRNDQITPEDILALSPQAVMIGSGNGSVQDTGVCKDLITLILGKIPVLCLGLGAEVLGECLGIPFKNSSPSMKSVFNTGFDTSCRLFSGIPAILPCSDDPARTADAAMPGNTAVTARDEFGRCIAFADNEKNAFGLAVYPIFFGENGKKMIRNFVSLIDTNCEQNV